MMTGTRVATRGHSILRLQSTHVNQTTEYCRVRYKQCLVVFHISFLREENVRKFPDEFRMKVKQDLVRILQLIFCKIRYSK